MDSDMIYQFRINMVFILVVLVSGLSIKFSSLGFDFFKVLSFETAVFLYGLTAFEVVFVLVSIYDLISSKPLFDSAVVKYFVYHVAESLVPIAIAVWVGLVVWRIESFLQGDFLSGASIMILDLGFILAALKSQQTFQQFYYQHRGNSSRPGRAPANSQTRTEPESEV